MAARHDVLLDARVVSVSCFALLDPGHFQPGRYALCIDARSVML